MIAVIFEVEIRPGKEADYLEEAAALAEELHGVQGFIRIERFRSVSAPNKILSLSYWESESAVAEWRNRESHRKIQSRGRAEIFADYTINVADVLRSYGMNDRTSAPCDSQRIHG